MRESLRLETTELIVKSLLIVLLNAYRNLVFLEKIIDLMNKYINYV
jgi:hypothetical protein